MPILIFRTNIKTKKKVQAIKPLFSNHPNIIHWNIDVEDIDNVLRIDAKASLTEKVIISLVNQNGFNCEVLPDYVHC